MLLLLFVSRHFLLVGIVALTTSHRNVRLSVITRSCFVLVENDVVVVVVVDDDDKDEPTSNCGAALLLLQSSLLLDAFDVDEIKVMPLLLSTCPPSVNVGIVTDGLLVMPLFVAL